MTKANKQLTQFPRWARTILVLYEQKKKLNITEICFYGHNTYNHSTDDMHNRLRELGLITKERVGRQNLYQLTADGVKAAECLSKLAKLTGGQP